MNSEEGEKAKKRPPVTFQCPLICEQGPSIPSSPTLLPGPTGGIPADVMQCIQMFSSQFDSARLSPNYATSDLGSSARSSFSTSSSWMAYRDRSVDFDETGKELISPFDCDTACSVSPSFSLSPNSFHHFSFDARSVSSLGHSTTNLNHLLSVGAAFELSRERSRSESDMQPVPTDESRLLTNSTISVPCYPKKSLKFGGEIKRSSSTPPPTTNEREEMERLLRPTSGLDNKEESATSLVSNWARDQIVAIQNASTVYNLLAARSAEDCSTLSAPGPLKVVPKTKEEFTPRDEASRAKQMQYPCTLCGQAFAVHDRLAKHIASRHRQRSCTLDDASKVHKCNMCSKSFSRSDMLTRHMRLHTGAKPYSCPTCNQVFSRSDHLSTHLRTHTGEKPYACPLCNYSASRRDMISRHMRTHSMTDDVSTPISQLSIRSASTSPLPPKIVDPTALVEIGSGELSAFKPILHSSSNLLSVSSPFQSLSLSTPSSPSFAPPTILLNRQSSFDMSNT
uniref:Early growth response protein 1 n=1 Tax=Caenorhabditis tropicalis TaxID=1561998 RepID=A0A1I7TKZ9_9PELO